MVCGIIFCDMKMNLCKHISFYLVVVPISIKCKNLVSAVWLTIVELCYLRRQIHKLKYYVESKSYVTLVIYFNIIYVVVRKAAEAGIFPIIVDNTNTQAWEMEPYVKISLQNGYRPVIAEPNTPWRYKAKELFK